MSEEGFWLTLWAIVGATLIGLSAVIGYSIRSNNQAAFDAGYERQQKVGSLESMWVKCEVTL
jgi:hypothetical protein